MQFIHRYIELLGGEWILLNLVLLISTCFIISSLLRNNQLRLAFSWMASLFIGLQVASLFFVQNFVNYQFYLHFNMRDITSMLGLYLPETAVFVTLLIGMFFFLFNAGRIQDRFLIALSSIHHGLKLAHKSYFINSLRVVIVTTSLIVMNNYRGLIYESRDLMAVLSANGDQKEFKHLLAQLGIHDYVQPEALVVQTEQKKNIIVISLESLEKGYLSDEMAQLTPYLRSLKETWTYHEMEQNEGSKWTSGSLFTSITGFPAYFGPKYWTLFNSTYHSRITGITHVLKKAGYTVTYLMEDSRFQGTQDMLNAFKVDEIIDAISMQNKTHDKDLFESTKLEIKENAASKKPFFIHLSTIDTHFPNGIYDKRMEAHLPPQASDLEFMVSALDYMLKDFISFLDQEGLLPNTVVYIYPDHLKHGDPAIFENTGERGLFLLTNAEHGSLGTQESDILNQIDLPEIVLNGAQITHNATFLSNYIAEDKNRFTEENIHELTLINLAGLSRIDAEPYIVPRISADYESYKTDTSRFIAHAGGIIDGHIYTNSIEALNENYNKGFRLFELDIRKTSDGKFVAVHHWPEWHKMVGSTQNKAVSHQEFLSKQILDTYTPLDIDRINDWFRKHEDAILITDKVNEPREFSAAFIDKSRLMMELFSWDAVVEGIRLNIKSAIPSEQVLESLEGDKLQRLKQQGISHVVVSRYYLWTHTELIAALKKNNIKVYVFGVTNTVDTDENYFVKHEMDHVYGIYADKWDFKN